MELTVVAVLAGTNIRNPEQIREIIPRQCVREKADQDEYALF